MLRENPFIVFLGAGVIGGSVGGWLAEKYANVFFMDQGKTAEALRDRGITLYPGDAPSSRTNTKVRVIDSFDQIPTPDVVVIGVKNYSLEPVSQIVKDAVGDAPVIIGMQNGIDNQRVLPKYFSKVVYCVVSYNAWADEPGVIGYQKKGPLHFGTLDEATAPQAWHLANLFNRGVETEYTDRIQDAIHSKIIINLTNSLTTLIGLKVREISDQGMFQSLLSAQLWEGVQIVKAAGFRESKLGGMPPWNLLWASSHLPQKITRPLFNRNVQKMVISSMAQDVIQRGAGQTELESINGYILSLADKVGHPAPVNRAVYDICKREFAKEGFEPLDVRDVYRMVHKG